MERDFVIHTKSGATIMGGTPAEVAEYLRTQDTAQKRRLHVIHTTHSSVEDYLSHSQDLHVL